MRKFETADRIRELMQEKQWKQVDIINNSKPFQEKLGVKLGKSALSQYVNGVQAPDQKKLALLALTFNVSEAWLMGYDVPRERDTSTSTTTTGYTETDLRKMAENAKTFDGKPLNENDIQAIQNIIEIYLKGRL
ncbi:helix-turn-helix domain-containing protein [Streptococcus sp. S2(2023)]|uniref:Helix-turn-helix domain-containing protein n=2 Tax=Streptococcus TaxID=1301 RepID=A0ABU6B8Q0_9STRE|nr:MULTISPECIES: helix-turn-helix domain-containing protein [unclassified Streptococcus]MEB3520227.1 helix-turn-helix domain-containing protein [Streptococcus sp. S2(2023)]MEB3521015.1 helix-turn-helix domain-containing protein [Streptococcus sp. S2(2023)]WPS47569.1 helix-turn-helix domain-containing protein [Streptococcus sp. S5]